MNFKTGGHFLGLHRVQKPSGFLPQAALCLDASLPPYENEVIVKVSSLQIDSASFKNLQDKGISIATQIREIVSKRGKMHNPETNSGGVFLGKVSSVGPGHPLSQKIHEGDSVISLVSLSLTPLHIEKIIEVDSSRERVLIEGHAILFESGMLSLLPKNFKEGVSLAALDICGAPAQTKRLVKNGDTLLVLGLGKAGRTIALQGELNGAHVLGIDPDEEAVNWCKENLNGTFEKLDATNPVAILEWVETTIKQNPINRRSLLCDVVISAVNREDCEMSAILPVKQGGVVLFFGMNTSFGRAVLGAEGIGKDVTLLMGNGYVPGHAELMFDLLRNHPALRQWFEEKFG